VQWPGATITFSSVGGVTDSRDDDAQSLKVLGSRLRRQRRAHRLTLREVAELSGLSVPFLSKVENGGAAPSLTSLFALARVLGTSPEWLLAAPTEDHVRFVPRDAGQRFQVTDDGRAHRRQLTGANEPFSAAEYSAEHGADLGGWNASPGREVIHVLSGRLLVVLKTDSGEETHTLRTGDTLVYDTSVPHLWKALGRDTTRFLHVLTDGTARAQELVPAAISGN
jgi:transcriptional regulator with XRE-family HTH domain